MANRILTNLLKALVTGPRGYDNWFPNKVKIVSVGNGTCLCELKVDEDLVTNESNTLHLGCISSIIDTISTLALMASPNPYPGVSIDLNVTYLSEAKLGDDILIKAKTLDRTKELAFLTADIRQKSDGEIIARGKHTKYVGDETVIDLTFRS